MPENVVAGSEGAPAVQPATAGKSSKLQGLPPETEKKLIGEHGEIAVVKTPLGAFAFSRPSQEDFERFIDKVAQDKSKKVAAARELCNLALVYPKGGEALATAFETYPALPVTVANKLQELAGQDFEIEVKKG
jgi:hypothetical protein